MKRQELVIVVDEDVAVRDSLKFQLELEGVRVCTCANQAELLALDELFEAQCIVVEDHPPREEALLLPRMLKLCKLEIPVILLASHATPALRRRADQAGIRQVLSKPLLGGELVDAIRENMD